MGISQAKWHKKRKTGGKRPTYKKKRKYELGRPASMTKIGGYRVHLVRVRGGNIKRRALRLGHGVRIGLNCLQIYILVSPMLIYICFCLKMLLAHQY